ncbi:MAG: thioredoxin family protein [Chitinophagales bacterium]
MKFFRSYLLLVFLIPLFSFSKLEKLRESAKENRYNLEEENIRMNGEWFMYVDDAYKESKATGKPIMANFTGSDWCGWCIRLKNEVFSKKEFSEWAKENVVLLELDFPRSKVLPDELKQQNGSLQQFFGVSGYPTIWLFNMEFDQSTNQFNIERLGKTGYIAGGVKNWTSETQKIIANAKK